MTFENAFLLWSLSSCSSTAVPVTFGSTSNSKTSFGLSCTVCGVEFDSASQADAHYSGKKHKNEVAKSEEVNICISFVNNKYNLSALRFPWLNKCYYSAFSEVTSVIPV